MKIQQIKVGEEYFEVHTPENLEEWTTQYGLEVLLHFGERGFLELARSNARNLLRSGSSKEEVEKKLLYFTPRYILRKLGSLNLGEDNG